MIGWLNPAAFVGLGLLAGPILVHLLLRQRAPRLPFPSLRFVRPSRTAAVRLRLPSDLWLLAIRLAIVAAAVAALAEPLVVTPSRLTAWNGRTARAIVVDTSESMRRAGADGRVPARQAEEIAAAESRGSISAVRIDAEDPKVGLDRAVARLAAAVPARREIVVISDFQQGALTRADVARVPASIGIRFVQVGEPQTRRTFSGAPLFAAGGFHSQSVTLAGAATGVSITPEPRPAPGLRLESADHASIAALVRAIASAGAPAPSSDAPLAIVFADGTPPPPPVRPVAAGWMLDTVLRLGRDGEAASAAAAETASSPRPVEPPWFVVFHDRQANAIVRAAAAGNELVIDVAAPASAFVSAAVVRAALAARAPAPARPEEEIDRIPTANLEAWSRRPPAVTADAWRSGAVSDARWWWALVLGLLGLEAVVRNPRRPADEEARRDAA